MDFLQAFKKLSHGLILGSLVQLAVEPALASQLMCENVLMAKNGLKTTISKPTLEQASQRMMKYRDSVSGEILEREYILDPFIIALLAKEHMLLIGPPGNAKTNLSKILLNNIVDAETGSTSFYSMQMNKEITLSDTHGSVNFKALSDEGAVKRNYDEGMLGARYAFVDESFDIRPGALRNLLDVLAERAHSQGTKQHKGLTEVVVAASNKTLPEVYEEFNNSEAPRALLDRFAFIFYVPKDMESIKSDRTIFKSARSYDKQVNKMTFQDLEVLRESLKQVEIPDYVADLASIIQYNLGPAYEAQEVKSLTQYREKVQNGEHSLPPFRASKYMSPRTLGKAGNILKAIVVLNYIKSGGKRSLVATTEDLSQLRAFYQLNGPNSAFLDKQLARSVKEHEKEQIKAVKIERDIANKIFDDVLKSFNEAIAKFRLPELDQKVQSYATLDVFERRKVIDLIKAIYLKGLNDQLKTDKEDVNTDILASQLMTDMMKEMVGKLFQNKTEMVLKLWENEAHLDPAKVSALKKRKEKFRYGQYERNQNSVAKPMDFVEYARNQEAPIIAAARPKPAQVNEVTQVDGVQANDSQTTAASVTGSKSKSRVSARKAKGVAVAAATNSANVQALKAEAQLDANTKVVYENSKVIIYGGGRVLNHTNVAPLKNPRIFLTDGGKFILVGSNFQDDKSYAFLFREAPTYHVLSLKIDDAAAEIEASPSGDFVAFNFGDKIQVYKTENSTQTPLFVVDNPAMPVAFKDLKVTDEGRVIAVVNGDTLAIYDHSQQQWYAYQP